MISRSMHFAQILPGRGPFSRIRRKRDAYGAILASQGPVAAATRGTGTRATLRRAQCGWGSASAGGGTVPKPRGTRERGPNGLVRRSAGGATRARIQPRLPVGAASAWTRCRSAGRGGRAVRQACRHGPELCRYDVHGHGGALSARCAWSRGRDATGVGRRGGQNYSLKCASITATRSFSASMSR